MKHILLPVLALLLSSCLIPTQEESITDDMLVGNWSEYVVEDNAAYLAIPDSLKSHDTVGYPVSSFISNICEIHDDGTYNYFVGLMDVEIGWSGTWTIHNGALYLQEENKPKPSPVTMRCIAPGKIELISEEYLNGKKVFHYRFLERWPE